MAKSPITCHVLDASIGKPAAGVAVTLSLIQLAAPSSSGEAEAVPQILAQGVTDNDGRCTTLLNPDPALKPAPGIYKMTFLTGPYFAAQELDTFYPFVEITFNYVDPSQHYHIPLLLSPFSYTTYRGS